MFNLIPLSLIIASLGGTIYILSGHFSEISISEEENKEDKSLFGVVKAKFAGWINQLPLDNMKMRSLSATQKLLHQMRAVLLKTDNRLMKVIGKISEKEKSANDESANGNISNVDFWNDLSNYKEEISQNAVIEKSPPRQVEKTPPFNSGEVKIELVVKKEQKIVEKIFDIKPVRKIAKTKKSPKSTPR